MPLQVQLGGRKDLGKRMTAIKVFCTAQLGFQRGRHRLPCGVVTRIAGKHGGIHAPVLVELRRKLDKVTRHGRSGKTWVCHVAKDAVQCMAKFMKERCHLVRGKQAGFALCRLGVVTDVVDDGLLI